MNNYPVYFSPFLATDCICTRVFSHKKSSILCKEQVLHVHAIVHFKYLTGFRRDSCKWGLALRTWLYSQTEADAIRTARRHQDSWKHRHITRLTSWCVRNSLGGSGTVDDVAQRLVKVKAAVEGDEVDECLGCRDAHAGVVTDQRLEQELCLCCLKDNAS